MLLQLNVVSKALVTLCLHCSLAKLSLLVFECNQAGHKEFSDLWIFSHGACVDTEIGLVTG